jgi:hypothetical protein
VKSPLPAVLMVKGVSLIVASAAVLMMFVAPVAADDDETIKVHLVGYHELNSQD